MTRKDLFYITAILALLAIATWIGRRDGRRIEALENEKAFMEQQIRDLQANRDSATARADREEIQRAKIVKTFTASQSDFKAEIRRLRKNLLNSISPSTFSPLGATVVTVMDSLGHFWQGSEQEFESWAIGCLTKDTILQVQDSLIFSLESEKMATTASFERQLSDMQEALKAEHAISETWRETAQDNSKRLRRANRWRRFWRTTAVVLGVAGAGFAIGSQ